MKEVMVLFDKEEEYAQLMTEFLKKRKNLPWELHTYTNLEDLLREEKEVVDMLVVAESAFCREVQAMDAGCLVVLSESGLLKWEDISYVDKYQEADVVLKLLLGFYVEIAKVQLPRLKHNCKTVFLGNYSPIRRSLQTSFALTLSQILAMEHSTLYLNFEYFAGIAELIPDMETFDLADLLYFLNSEQDKFRLRFQSMLKRKGNLDYIPPMKLGQNLLTVTEREWLALLQKLEELEEYEYIVLDLSECMQGLFEILKYCSRIYTTIREDKIAKAKLMQYEQMLALSEYEEILEKSRRLDLSHIRKIPGELEQLTKGQLAELARDMVKDLEKGGMRG